MGERYGEWLRKRRLALGMTQAQLAAQIGSDKSYINKIERGKIETPTLETRLKIKGVFGFDERDDARMSDPIDPRVFDSGFEKDAVRKTLQVVSRSEIEDALTGDEKNQLKGVTDEELQSQFPQIIAKWTPRQKSLLLSYIELVSAALDAVDPPQDDEGDQPAAKSQ